MLSICPGGCSFLVLQEIPESDFLLDLFHFIRFLATFLNLIKAVMVKPYSDEFMNLEDWPEKETDNKNNHKDDVRKTLGEMNDNKTKLTLNKTYRSSVS